MATSAVSAKRVVSLASVCLLDGKQYQKREYVVSALQTVPAKTDIVALPHMPFLTYRGRATARDLAPFVELARQRKTYVALSLTEEAAGQTYYTALLLDRTGKIVGKYRKTHLPREEWRQGVTPGSEYPVFKTDFGTVAIQICYDWFFPEVVTAFAAQGAEIVFAPTWGTTFADKEGKVEGETVFRVRARDNGVYMVPSVYDGCSMVIDPLGRILASNKGETGVFWAEADLNEREPLWRVGHWRAIGPRDRMPYTYAPLVDPMQGPTY